MLTFEHGVRSRLLYPGAKGIVSVEVEVERGHEIRTIAILPLLLNCLCRHQSSCAGSLARFPKDLEHVRPLHVLDAHSLTHELAYLGQVLISRLFVITVVSRLIGLLIH